ncbi:elongation factor EF-2 [Candidatus Hecatella orcuttiae]|uniref:elongation factor EF-2 n=1 Tax=Candidatus Hecatella orcuttiae TaxID=1935119 RepID=UPI0028681CC9|nr:elongation factor EF-2 [Candidatus Hecatella orcuttiae]
MPKFKTTGEITKIVQNLEQVRNAGIIAHVDHGKTTLTDSLLSAAGLLSPSVAGQALALDYLEEEQKRQMTIKAANISLYYEIGDRPYVINLIDTPGHVDFTGRVTRSLRAIDGCMVVVDAVEEVMVQTETVTRQSLEERVRPILFINKIDRLIKELRLTPAQVQEKLTRIIRDFNNLIEIYAEPEYKDRWKVNLAAGNIAFGSAKDRWGLTLQMVQERGIKFSDIVEYYQQERVGELVKIAPLHEAVLPMLINHVPLPHVAQKYRIPKIWKGDPDSEVGQAMINCDRDGPAVMCVTNVVVDPQAGVVATGRLFSGVLNTGDVVHLVGAKSDYRIQQVCIYMGQFREVVGSLPCGNIPALLGLEKAKAGETVSTFKDVVPFEGLQYISEPVVTVAVEPKHSKDLPRLVDFLRKLSIEDPNLVTKINEETGEYLISGMGQLHLEIATTWIQKAGLDIITSQPIILYRESVREKGQVYEGKSPNKHNRIFVQVEPLQTEVIELIKKGEISDYTDKHRMAKTLRDLGWDPDEAKGVWRVDEHGNILTDVTKGIQRLDVVKDSIISAFNWTMEEGPIAHEIVRGVKVSLQDAQIHEDPVHTGPAQIMPATRRSLYASFLSADPVLLEPILKVTVKVPSEHVGNVTKIIAGRRGRILSMEQKEYLMYVVGEIPASETFDLSEAMRGSTAGRAFWGTEFSRWENVPSSLIGQIIRNIRKRKGLPPEPPKVSDFIE